MAIDQTDRAIQIIGVTVITFMCGFGTGVAATWWWPAAAIFVAGVLVGVLGLAFMMAASLVHEVERYGR